MFCLFFYYNYNFNNNRHQKSQTVCRYAAIDILKKEINNRVTSLLLYLSKLFFNYLNKTTHQKSIRVPSFSYSSELGLVIQTQSNSEIPLIKQVGQRTHSLSNRVQPVRSLFNKSNSEHTRYCELNSQCTRYPTNFQQKIGQRTHKLFNTQQPVRWLSDKSNSQRTGYWISRILI